MPCLVVVVYLPFWLWLLILELNFFNILCGFVYWFFNFIFLSACFDPVMVGIKGKILPCSLKMDPKTKLNILGFKRPMHITLNHSRNFNYTSLINFCFSGFWRLLSLSASHGGETVTVGPQGNTNPTRKRSQGKNLSGYPWFILMIIRALNSRC